MKVAIKNMRVIWMVLAMIGMMAAVATGGTEIVSEEFMTTTGTKARLVPKVDRFVILLDQSGSMYQTDQGRHEAKARLGKEIMLAMNERIPELGYAGAIHVFSTRDETLVWPGEYRRASFGETIHNLPEEGRIYGNRTPLGRSILHLDEAVDMSKGKTGVIIVSDGNQNWGIDALEAARKMYTKYPSTCFHAISLADDARGRTILEEISRMGDCVYAEGSDLTSDPRAVDRFVSDVFYLVELEKVVQMEEVAQVEESPAMFAFATVYFGFDKRGLNEQAKAALDRIARELRNNPELRVVIQGYTDQIGSRGYNQKLSQWRAQAVYDYFHKRGIPSHRMDAAGFGKTRLVTTDMAPASRALNRRVETKAICSEKLRLAQCVVWPETEGSERAG